MTFPLPSKPWLLVALVSNKKTQETQLHFRQIESNYPVDGTFRKGEEILFKPYLPMNTAHRITSPYPTLTVYHYRETFPPGSPPFAEKESKVDPVMEVDSTFKILSGEPVSFSKEGLYLLQGDTNAVKGIAVRAVNPSFPKMTRIEDVAASMIFITTQEEFNKVQDAGGDKTKFDRVILEITRDKERARNLIRHYFRRVEQANIFFTSYKEGWKTDRGMIYLIFGQPDEVTRSGDNEVWAYRDISARFTFVKTGSLYDPDYFVLVRDKRFRETWYYTIDLWRKSQISSAQRN